jgi:glycerol dehydrogenase-like iron-containing ADH family enzyme
LSPFAQEKHFNVMGTNTNQKKSNDDAHDHVQTADTRWSWVASQHSLCIIFTHETLPHKQKQKGVNAFCLLLHQKRPFNESRRNCNSGRITMMVGVGGGVQERRSSESIMK